MFCIEYKAYISLTGPYTLRNKCFSGVFHQHIYQTPKKFLRKPKGLSQSVKVFVGKPFPKVLQKTCKGFLHSYEKPFTRFFLKTFRGLYCVV
jgi:hypothetical protein